MKLSKPILTALAMGVGLALQAGPTLLYNGDFELPTGITGTTLSVGNTIPGWTVVGTGSVNVYQDPAGQTYWPGNTSQYLDLTGYTGGAGIQSDPIITTPGMTYDITFDAFNGSEVFPGAYTGPALSVQASGSPIEYYNGSTDLPPGIQEELTYSFIAVSGTTTLTFMDTSGFDSNAGWIDNVAIQEVVPEPSTTILFGMSLLLFGVRALRKNRAA